MYKTHERLRDRRNQILTGEDGLAAGGSGAERLGGVVGFGSGSGAERLGGVVGFGSGAVLAA